MWAKAGSVSLRDEQEANGRWTVTKSAKSAKEVRFLFNDTIFEVWFTCIVICYDENSCENKI